MMRVALLVNFIPPYRLPLLRALAARVQSLRVFVSTPMEADRTWAVDWQDLEVVEQRTISFARRWRHPAGFEERVFTHLPYDTLQQLGRYRPDVVLTGEFGVRTLLATAYGSAWRRTPVVVWATLSERLEEGRGRVRAALRGLILSRCSGVLVNGESGARYIKRFSVPDERITRVPQPVDVDRFAAPHAAIPWPHDVGSSRRLAYVGRMAAGKGLGRMLETVGAWAAAHPQEQVDLRMVGSGPEEAALRAHPLPPNLSVQWLGSLSYAEIPRAYAGADMLVFPSLADEWGLVVNEAMAAGVPVLGSTYAQAVEELVQDGVNGWRFVPDAPNGFDAALERALSTPPEVRQRMSAAAAERSRRLTPEFAAGRIVEALQRAG